MALLQRLKPPPNQTFGSFAMGILRIKFIFLHHKGLDLVFDCYDESKSIKTSERLNDETPIPKWKIFVSHEGNKVRLCHYLVDYLKEHAIVFENDKTFIIGGASENSLKGFEIAGDQCVELPELESDHEEADTRIILHADHAFNDFFGDVTINSRDTDLSVIALFTFSR